MINYEVWQMPPSNPNKFLHLEWCKKSPNIKDYVLVYSGKIKLQNQVGDTLESIFEALNCDYPDDYHVASLSVSDVICLEIGNVRAWYYVDGVGFKKLHWKI